MTKTEGFESASDWGSGRGAKLSNCSDSESRTSAQVIVESKGETYVAVATVVVTSVSVTVVRSVKTTMSVEVDVKVDVGRM